MPSVGRWLVAADGVVSDRANANSISASNVCAPAGAICRPGPLDLAFDRRRRRHIPGKAKRHQQADDNPGHVDLPPLMAVARGAGIGVMVVVPAFAGGKERDQRVVAAYVGRRVVAVAPEMRNGIDRPRNVPRDHRAQRSAPDKKAQSELRGVGEAISSKRRATETGRKEEKPGAERDLHPVVAALDPGIERIPNDVLGVSLDQRAPGHVFLFDQQPSHMRPEKAGERAVRILVFIGKLMMAAMHCYPMGR